MSPSPSMRWRTPTVALAAAVLIVASARSQDPAPQAEAAGATDGAPQEQFFESIDVSVVNVDVFVTDKKGNRIRGLTRDDFELFEDGKPIQITNFYAVDESSPAAPATLEPAPVPTLPGAAPEATVPEDQRLHLVVYVDNWNIKPFNRNRVFSSIREFLRTRLGREDRVMLMTFDREPHVRRPFTSDPAVIASALFDIEKLSANGSRQDSDRREILRELVDMEDANRAIGRARMYAESLHNDLMFSIDSLKDTVSSLAGLPGRKAILYVSDGLPLVAGEDVFHAIQEKFPDAGSAVLESRAYDVSRRFRELTAAANANRITFYTIDAEGLRVSTSISAEEGQSTSSTFVDSVHWNNIQGSIRMIADETGGIAIVNTNDPTKGLVKVGDDLRNYYSLGYTPAHVGDGRYHEIRVKVRDKSWVVRHREGYRDKTTEARMADGVMSSLFYDVENNPLEVRIEREVETRRDDGHFLVPVKVRIPLGRLVMIPEGENQIARVRIFFAAMDEKGGLSEVSESPVPISIPSAQIDAARGQTYVFTVPVMMRRGPQKLAVGVRDELGQVSSFAVRTMNIGGG